MRFPRLNWNIYESDILRLGGTVEYIGLPYQVSRRSTIQDALITLGPESARVQMERFSHGDAVLVSFWENGKLSNILSSSLESRAFISLFDSMVENDEALLVHSFCRKWKQTITFLGQCACFVGVILSIRALYRCCMMAQFNVFPVGTLLFSIILFALLGNAYKYFRKGLG